jgi:murein DD-endopeptidase MepM/ murein hydrolase activator NlpD
MTSPRHMTNELRLVVLAFVLFTTSNAYSIESPNRYPVIPNLDSRDPVFMQYSEDVQAARGAIAAYNRKTPLPVHLYSYKVKTGDTLLAIAARCSIPYDAIASINRIPSLQEPIEGRTLILPSLPGLYLPDTAASTLERLLLSSFDPDDLTIISFSIRNPADSTARTVHCIPDAVFDGTVRAFFVTPSFRFPLPEAVVTSSFGMRKNPVTGNLIFHKGIDLAAPAGTPVLACADGIILATGYDPIYGNFVTIRHEGGKESLYGHLSSIKSELQDRVKSGSIIGTVGSTGQSTGPHLHFEMHENGVPKNPAGFIKGN